MVLQQNQRGKSLKSGQTDLALRHFFSLMALTQGFSSTSKTLLNFSPSCAGHGNPKLLPAPGNLLHSATLGLSGLRD